MTPTGQEMPIDSMKPRIDNLEEWLLRTYGPLMKAQELQVLLRFRSPTAFSTWLALQEEPIEFVKIPHRRGWFVYASHVANWLRRNPQRRPYTGK